MNDSPVLFAAGPRGVDLAIPAQVKLSLGAQARTHAPKNETEQRALIDAALEQSASGPTLKELASGKRRVAILAGDLCRPAPYEIALPALVAALVKAGIRPSRIALFACPGGCGPLLGRAAIHRYGEEFCGEHDAMAWPENGQPGAGYDAADLRIAVAPRIPGETFDAFLPKNAGVDAALELKLDDTLQVALESAHFSSPPAREAAAPRASGGSRYDVMLVSGGGGPWEETLEEALLSLHRPHVSARTAVLVFSGHEGLGSARFSRDAWSLIEQADEALANGASLGKPAEPAAFDPAGTLAEGLRRYSNMVLFAPEFVAHADGEDLAERLAAVPRAAARLNLCADRASLWKALTLLHGESFSAYAEPLGWRA